MSRKRLIKYGLKIFYINMKDLVYRKEVLKLCQRFLSNKQERVVVNKLVSLWDYCFSLLTSYFPYLQIFLTNWSHLLNYLLMMLFYFP